METPRGSRDTHTQDGAAIGEGVCVCARARVGEDGGNKGPNVEWEEGRSLLQDFPVKEGDGEERRKRCRCRAIPIEGRG